MSLFKCSGVINTAVLDKESYPFFLNGPATVNKPFVRLALYDIQSHTRNFQNSESENSICESSVKGRLN